MKQSKFSLIYIPNDEYSLDNLIIYSSAKILHNPGIIKGKVWENIKIKEVKLLGFIFWLC